MTKILAFTKNKKAANEINNAARSLILPSPQSFVHATASLTSTPLCLPNFIVCDLNCLRDLNRYLIENNVPFAKERTPVITIVGHGIAMQSITPYVNGMNVVGRLSPIMRGSTRTWQHLLYIGQTLQKKGITHCDSREFLNAHGNSNAPVSIEPKASREFLNGLKYSTFGIRPAL